MACSSEPKMIVSRGFVPPRNEEERLLMRHVQDMWNVASARGIPRHTGFLTGREQDLCRAAMNKCGCYDYFFEGGWNEAERRVLVIRPRECPWEEQPVACLMLQLSLPANSAAPEHRDYLGALMGLQIDRGCVGDILPDNQNPGRCYVFAMEDKADFFCRELTSVGKFPLRISRCSPELVEQIPRQEHVLKTGTVSSMRLDAVLSEIMGIGRSQATELIVQGKVQINHLSELSQHAPVYEGDSFTVRGKGKYRLLQIKGKSKKGRFIIEYYKY